MCSSTAYLKDLCRCAFYKLLKDIAKKILFALHHLNSNLAKTKRMI